MTEEARQAQRTYMKNYMRAYRSRNKEKVKEQAKEWRAANPERMKMYRERYWQRKAEG